MTSRGFSRIEELYHAALRRPPGERVAFLEQACAGDEVLLREVKSLLGYEAEADRLFEQPVSEAVTRRLAIVRGTRFGPYEILDWIGSGGMGDVYRARDTRLERTVAVKVLPAELTRDPDARQRFEREARAVAALSHPHICTLHDIGHQDGTDFLVMEFLDGETLAQRLTSGKLPLDHALQSSIQIADALAAAHRSGIIHRDLKPGNVMLTKDGAKLLDFGLAKPRAPAVARGQTVTLDEPLTGQGTILGTLQYMAPEQLEGKEADTRTDIFAFGVTMYEMFTGRKAFEAATDASLIGAILRDEVPSICAAQPLAPRPLDRLLRACTAKDPDDRWQNAWDLRRELGWLREDRRASTSDRAGKRHSLARRRAAFAGAAVLMAVLTVLVVTSLRQRANPMPLARLTIHLPDSNIFSSAAAAQISPDGRHVAFWTGSDERTWIRSLNASSAEAVRGLEHAAGLFWSPDSRQLGFTTTSAVKKLTVSDKTVVTLCEGCKPGWSGTWSRSGLILFPTEDGRLLGISAAGGEPQVITSPDRSKGEIAHIAPHFLPDGQRFLYVIRSADTKRGGLYVGQVGSHDSRLLLQGDHPAIYVPGYLLFARQGSIVAQPFDAERLEFSGEVVPLVGPSEYWPASVHGGNALFQNWFGTWPSFSSSDTGTFAYAIFEHPELQFQWIRRGGELLQVVGAPGPYMSFDLAPDGTRLVFSRGEGAFANLWMSDLMRNMTSRLTFGAGSSYYDPRWASGTEWVAANRPVPRPAAMVKILPDGREFVISGSESEICVLDDVSTDGHYALCRRNSGRDLMAVQLGGSQEPVLVRSAPAGYIDQPQFSPDGRWIAYNANETGRHEVYVTGVLPTGERWQVSDEGGVQPVWRQDGREIYYLRLDGVLTAVAVQGTARPPFSAPHRLFDTGLVSPSPEIEQYAASSDGQQFLLLKPLNTRVRNSVGVILNWPALLQARQSR
jgi:serine/threonine protein kinase